MIKKTVVIILSCCICIILNAQTITSGMHYDKDFVESLIGYKTIFSISIKNRHLDVLAKELPQDEQVMNEKYVQYKMLILNNDKGNFLDAMGCMYVDFTQSDKTYVDDATICFRIQDLPLNGFAYVNSSSEKIAVYESSPMLSNFVVTDEYIVYSYTRSTPALFKISLKSGEITPYDWDAPSAVLYPSPDSQYIAFFEKNYRDPTQYAVTETEVIKLETDFAVPKVLRLSDFRIP